MRLDTLALQFGDKLASKATGFTLGKTDHLAVNDWVF